MARPSSYPHVGVVSTARLLGSLAVASARSGGWRPGLHEWVRGQSARGRDGDLELDTPGGRFLLVNGAPLSAEILREPPSTERLVGGRLRQRSMGFLAPRALTISNDGDWERRRAYNERVLATGRPHDHRQAYLEEVHAAFAAPVGAAEAIRDAMGRLMLAVVLGDDAPADLPQEVRGLMGVVRSPIRRVLVGRFYAGRRTRFYDTLRRQWDRAPDGTLVGRFRGLGVPPSTESLEQVPHWMFTFVLSGTDLLTRALALIGSRPEALRRVRAEIDAAGPLDEAASIDRLAYLAACVREAGRLFAPVTGTTHTPPSGVDLDRRHIPAGTRIVHYFPLTQRNTAIDPTADDFAPERWLDPSSEAHRLYPNLFLSGARECPGRDLIMFLCTSAIAIQTARHGLRVEAPSLRSDPLPLSFPSGDLRFHARPTDHGGDEMAVRAGRSYSDLMNMRQRELDALYRDIATPGEIPVGDTRGTALVLPGRAAGRVAQAIARLLIWQGKVFDPRSGMLRNKVTPVGIRAVRARVYVGDSRLDRGTQATVLDYSKTSWIARWVRDEIREVAPGLWLGKVFVGRWHVLDFTLQAGAR